MSFLEALVVGLVTGFAFPFLMFYAGFSWTRGALRARRAEKKVRD